MAAQYQTYGCGPTIASGSMLTELIVERSIAECRKLSVRDLIEALDGVPPDKLHCPALAIGARKGALSKRPTDEPGETPTGRKRKCSAKVSDFSRAH